MFVAISVPTWSVGTEKKGGREGCVFYKHVAPPELKFCHNRFPNYVVKSIKPGAGLTHENF
jgi:hypothetical protein